MLKRVVKDSEGNIIEEVELEIPKNDKSKNKKQDKRKDTEASKESK